jgi:tRNA threonylcarbamoyladenosine biosynthesis protein TsaB
MLILAFDTTQECGGVGIFRDSQCLASAPHSGLPDYAVSLFQEVQSVLEKAQVQFGDIGLYACVSGPGSFTGIRVGIAAAQGWGSTFRRPMRGVSLLEAMVEEAHPETSLAAAIMDALRGEFYCALFRRTQAGDGSRSGVFEPASDGLALKPEELARVLQSNASEGLTCVAREQDSAACALRQSLPSSYGWQNVNGYLVSAITRVAIRAYEEKRPPSMNELYAYYIRRPDAEITSKA